MNTLVVERTAEEPSYLGEVSPFDRRAGSMRVERLLEASGFGVLETSLAHLVVSGLFPTVGRARRAVADLEPVDHIVSVDVLRVPERAVFEIRWMPVTGIINLMLDWNLSVLEITVAELAAWLEVDKPVVHRALTRLGEFPGVRVDTGMADDLHIVLDVNRCPLTSAASRRVPGVTTASGC